MKKTATFCFRVFTFVAGLCFLSGASFATAWYTGTAGNVNTLSNWTNGSTSPTSFTTAGDTWTVNLSMTLPSAAVWTLGASTGSPDTLFLTTGGSINVGGIPTTPVINVYGTLMLNGGTLSMGGTAAAEIVNVYGSTVMSSGTITTPASVAHLVINTTGTCYVSGGTATSTGSSASITFNTTGDFNMTGGLIGTSAAGAFDTVRVMGNFNMTGGTITAGGAGCKALTYIYGNASISGTAAFTMTGAGCTNNLHFSLPTSAGLMMIHNTSTGSWSATNAWIDSNCAAQLDGNFNTTMGGSGYGLTVNGILICPAAYTVVGTNKFILNGRASLIVGHATGINGAIVNTGTRTFNDTANYGFNGTVAQVTGTDMPAALYAPDSILINNTAGVTLSQSTSTTGTLLFGAGILNTSTYTMKTTGAASSVAGAGATSFVNGNLQKTIATYNTVNFEVGDATYAPMQLTFDTAGTSGSFTLKCNSGLHTAVASSGLSGARMVNHYWTITNNSASGPDSVLPRATYPLGDILGGSNGYFVTQRYNGTAWMGTPWATTNTVSPYTSAVNTGQPIASIAGDYIFGRVGTTLDVPAVTGPGELHVFPNPNDGRFAIRVASVNDEEMNVTVINVTGAVVKQFVTRTNTTTEMTLDQPAGVYFLSAQTAAGSYKASVILR